MVEGPRIEELRRRVESDPASIAFAQLAEEYRRTGDFEQAVRVCRAGLEQHPTYLSARVTLGRALFELERFDEAQAELDYVIRAAPGNLAAIRGLAEIHQRRGDVDEPSRPFPAAHAPAHDEPPAPDFSRAMEALDAITLDQRVASAVEPEDSALRDLESWLEAILAERKARQLPTPNSQLPNRTSDSQTRTG